MFIVNVCLLCDFKIIVVHVFLLRLLVKLLRFKVLKLHMFTVNWFAVFTIILNINIVWNKLKWNRFNEKSCILVLNIIH